MYDCLFMYIGIIIKLSLRIQPSLPFLLSLVLHALSLTLGRSAVSLNGGRVRRTWTTLSFRGEYPLIWLRAESGKFNHVLNGSVCLGGDLG